MPSVCIKGVARFRHDGKVWTSHNAWCSFTEDKNGRPRPIKFYGQRPRSGGPYAKPWFGKQELDRMKKQAKRMFQRMADKHQASGQVRHAPDMKPHEEGLCERCQELKFPCNGMLVDVMGKQFTINKRDRLERKKRLRDGEKKTLYHQTSRDVAELIKKTQEMKPGQVGLAGGGIYFALSPEDTHGKAQHLGPILECTVYLGNTKQLGPSGDPSLDFQKLQNDPEGPYDSVLILRDRPEYVVYMSDQVEDICYHN
ncbi:uncharacterized protein MONBRDRAFT_31459 [Monosiga brevicollis MX1]|uniref:3CxxC-type domain-containing protein n=1 Tax=Monosiga brevicollis TaxID=81824 RepID=A9UTA6_MONBE|nr:uncharacterized protein MONBRDRAFT_31459 [Monosiga brevicollis MX1]EDQ91212.1 predicted protein [Monosiga brevicollis MX1]|eukprot:XP_001743634.1 hypothetical protein [Monosiga brevicollis MX1]